MSTAAFDTTAQSLAEFAHGLTLAAVPAATQQRALHLMLDAVGCALAARQEDFALKLAPAIASLADTVGRRGVIGFGQRLPLRDVTWLNGVLMHGLDYDDTHMAGVVHLTVSVLPAVWSLAAERRASGAQMLLAYIAGVEAGARIASVVKGGLHTQGFHPTGVVGAFASAVAAGKLIGLNVAQLVGAQGIALSLASGNLQFLEDGAWTKRLHPGWAAQAGVQAARLAAHDIPAPAAPYEGRFGLFRAYLGPDLQARTDITLGSAGLGRVWELEQIAIKPFPMCHFVHAAADAAIALHGHGVAAADIERIDALMPAGTMPVVCEPIAAKRRPGSDYDAKFSLPYAVASGLLRGRLGLQELLPAAFTEPAALALMDRVHVQVDPASTFPLHYSGELRVTLKDGEVLRHREPVNRGHAERPLSNAEIQRKYADNAALHFASGHAHQVQQQLLSLPQLADVSALETLLAQDPLNDTAKDLHA
jgi:2-methylcitrate dehydratase PrpD